MEIEQLANKLQEHESASQTRYENLIKHVTTKEAKEMGHPINVFTPPADGGGSALPLAAMAMSGQHGLGGVGGGLGAGLVGGLLGGLIFGRGGLGFGGAAVDGVGCGTRRDCLTSEMAATQTMGLANAIGGVADKVASGDLMIQQAICSGFANQGQMTLQQTIMLIQQANLNQTALMSELCNVNQNVSAQGCMTREAIGLSTNTITGLINQLNTENLNRKLTIADLDRRDEGNRARQREVEVNVTQTVNQNQLQLQAQQQQQQIVATLGFLCNEIAQVKQVARATNENVIVGNTGATTTGAQTANPTNVNTR